MHHHQKLLYIPMPKYTRIYYKNDAAYSYCLLGELSVGYLFHMKVTSQTFNQTVYSQNSQVDDHQTHHTQYHDMILEPTLKKRNGNYTCVCVESKSEASPQGFQIESA